MVNQPLQFTSVYGPVKSWRFGRSLGIDPIGPISSCSFNCVYCQLGEIEHLTRERQVFVSTQQILWELQAFVPWDVDVITLSGSGEPTLALNLGEILLGTKILTNRAVGVLTNGSLLSDQMVRAELAIADWVAVKVDALTEAQLQRINRPISWKSLPTLRAGLQQFRREFSGRLIIQTMLLNRWSETEQQDYIHQMKLLQPDEIHLNTPTRPKPARHELAARGNHQIVPYRARPLKPLRAEILEEFGEQIRQATGISVRCTSR